PPDFRIMYASSQSLRYFPEPYSSGAPITGLTAGELGVEPTAQSAAIRQLLARTLETGEPVRFERFESNNPRTGKTWWNWSAVPIRERGTNEQQYIMLIAIDVTEQVMSRRKEEHSAQAARARADELETVIRQMADGVLIFDREGQL